MESRVDWYRIRTKAQDEYPFLVRQTKLNLQDMAIDLDEVTELESTQIFSVDAQGVVPEERYEEVIASFSIGVDLDQRVIQRMGYTFMDVLSDIGGI